MSEYNFRINRMQLVQQLANIFDNMFTRKSTLQLFGIMIKNHAYRWTGSG